MRSRAYPQHATHGRTVLTLREMEAAVRIELTNTGFADPRLTTWLRRQETCTERPNAMDAGAGNGIRTRDPDLGKVVLYH